jgi:hypothetical protein
MEIAMSIRRCLGVATVTVMSLCLGAVGAQPSRSLNDLTGPWQLFVDDYLVASKEHVVRTYHPFEKDPRNPLLKADRPWEGNNVYLYGTVLPNESGPGYRMWYHALPETKGDDAYRLLYATSRDGITWEKPNLGFVEYKGSKDNNIFIRRGSRDHIPSIIHTPWEKDPQRQYLMINYDGDKFDGYVVAWSPDGLRWTDAADKAVFTKGGDVGQFLYDFHKGEYVGYVKNTAQVSDMRRRAVARIASKDPLSWPEPELVLAPDTFDDRWAHGIQRTSFYGLSAFAYESMYLGFLWVFRADDETEGYFDGPIFCELVTSRDGVHWMRQQGERVPVLPVGTGKAWDRGMVFSATQPLVVDGKVWLYYGGVDGKHLPRKNEPWHSGIGLATLRKDGFASLDAKGETGTVLTRRLVGARGPLRVNYTASGSLRVEVLDATGNVLPGYGRDDCTPLTGDSIDATVAWRDRRTLQGGRPIRLRFILENASLYSFAAGGGLKVLDEPTAPLGVLFTFENGWTDSLTADGKQRAILHGDMRIDSERANVAFGGGAARVGSTFAPLQTLEIDQTRELGTQFTLSVMAKSKDNRPARLFSSYEDRGAYKTTELVFDCDPNGKCLPGLRLIVKGMEVHSGPVTFADDKYHHLAVTYDDGRITFYLDGKVVGRGLVPGGDPVSMIRNLRIGEDAAHGHEQQFRGWMDDVLVYGRALTPNEISALGKQGAEAFFKARQEKK